MSTLALLLLLATGDPKLELRAPDRLGEPSPGSPPPVLYTGDGKRDDGIDWNKIIVIAGGVLIVIAFYMTTRRRKAPEEQPPDQEAGDE